MPYTIEPGWADSMFVLEQRRSTEDAVNRSVSLTSRMEGGNKREKGGEGRMMDLERGSYPEEILSTELLNGWSVCKESLSGKSGSDDSGDSESGPKGDDKGLGSPIEMKKKDQQVTPDSLLHRRAGEEFNIPQESSNKCDILK